MDYKKIIRSRAARENILRALAFIPDEAMLRIQYRIKTGRALHLRHPTRFTEKRQWYKLYYRDPDMLRCVDKYEVRAYLRERGFQDLLPRCFGVFDSPDLLPVPQLPDRFVLKDTLGSGGNAVLLCPDKTGPIGAPSGRLPPAGVPRRWSGTAAGNGRTTPESRTGSWRRSICSRPPGR